MTEPNEESQKEQLFPKTFDSCPNCNSKRRMADMIVQELIAKGANKALKAWVVMNQSKIADPTRTTLTDPVLITIFDVCYDCGTLYCIEAGVKVVVKGMGQGPMPGQFNKN